jgi:predicted phosphodiesterase
MNRQKRFTLWATLLLTLAVAATASATPWKFAVLCDSRASYSTDGLPAYYDATYGISPYFAKVAKALSRESGLDFVLYPGDLVRGKKPALSDAQFAADIQEWNNQMKPVTDAGVPVYFVRGNHDAGNASGIWNSNITIPTVNPIIQDPTQTGLTYSFTHKGSLFVGLDEYPTGAAGATAIDRAFLNAQLAKQAQHKFVFAHQPLWNYKSSELGPATLADDLNNGGADLYFSGHVHSYQRIVEKGYGFQEMIIGTGGAPQDNPTLVPGDPGYLADPKLVVKSYAGGSGSNARFGYAVITVNDDGSISSEMKFLDNPASDSSPVSSFDSFTIPAKPWKFGVMSDTQWPTSPDGKNPNVAVNVIRHLNTEFINQGVKFVVQVGDLTDTVGTNNINLDVRATFAQDLYNAGIGFYPLRGNHESSTAGAVRFQQIFPQTQTGVNNQTPNMVATTIYGTQANSNSPFAVGTNFATEPGYEGLIYSFDNNNARFVIIDQFTAPSGAAHSNLTTNDISWIGGRLSTKPAKSHAFTFAHKGLITENHNDNLFNSTNPDTAIATTWPLTNSYMSYLQDNGVRYHMGGHDHMHNRAIVSSPDGLSKVQNIIGASNSYKFYIPPTTAALTAQSWRSRENQIAQELFTVGYYIFTVDGPRVTVDHYAMPNGCNGDCDLTYDIIPYSGNTPTTNYVDPVPFTRHDTFGYSLNGKEVLVPQGGSYLLSDNTAKAVANAETGYRGTSAAILSGTNGSRAKDYNNRPLTKSVNTGWSPKKDETASDIFTLWGMTDNLSTNFTDLSNTNNHYKYVVPDTTVTDTYALSMTYDPASVTAGQAMSGEFGLAVRTDDGRWVNAVAKNNGGTMHFVTGTWNSGYALGTYGIDTATSTVWAVVNHAGDFAAASFALTDISSRVKVSSTGFLYSRVTNKFNGTLTLTNSGAATLTGPFVLLFNGLTAGVTLDNASGSYNGYPHLDLTTTLDPGHSITTPLTFTNPAKALIKFTPVTFQAQ